MSRLGSRIFHLEGMGVMGCLVACMLRQEGSKFTWEDTYVPDKVAWKASTGAILPFGDKQSQEDLKRWRSMLRSPDEPLGLWFLKYVTEARYCYVADQPPHNGKKVGIKAEEVVGNVKVSSATSLHMDVQTFVMETRRRFWKLERSPADRAIRIVTHGFGANLWKWSWGWSAQVRVEFAKEWERACGPLRPMLYGRKGYQLPYLYPVGHTGYYYAGTTLITQGSHPKTLEVQPKFDMWKQHIKEYTGGLAKVKAVRKGTMLAGWRPMPNPDDALVETFAIPPTVVIAPQYGNGIRWFPSTWDALVAAIEEEL